ncbi:MAG: type II toxin-antitoxin system prevent-host-death family antitoxin [Candidatus Eremiobacteraeota bacterium]|nr:type II toxin-antitoxin system prevent-host-death family antitoxin [Candidatus Eremiobacteraeota bacterium]
MVRRTAGVREAKSRLSDLLRDVKRGREWVITERGKPVARLIPASKGPLTLDDRLRRLEQEGLIEPLSGVSIELPPLPAVPSGIAQRMLQEDRDG